MSKKNKPKNEIVPSQLPVDGEEQKAAGNLPAEIPSSPHTQSGPQPSVQRPGLEGFERWLQKTMIVKLLVVIVVAFLFKVFVPTRISFTLGLAVGLAVLIIAYVVDYYRQTSR